MPVNALYVADQLDLIFQGDLDATISQDIRDICKGISSNLKFCIIDLSGVERLFESGVAQLRRLHRYLSELGIVVVILSDHPEIRERVLDITPMSSHPPKPAHGGELIPQRTDYRDLWHNLLK